MNRRRWITWALVGLVIVSIPIFAGNFKWDETRHMFANANWGLLIVAALVNILRRPAGPWTKGATLADDGLIDCACGTSKFSGRVRPFDGKE